jgi:hypothetical protein
MKCIAAIVLAFAAVATPGAPVERSVPFAAGETLRYDVSWASFLTAGTVSTTVREKRPSFNSIAYYIVAEGRPTALLAKLYAVYYKIDTLLDSFTLLPQRGSVYSEEGLRHRFKVTQFDRGANKVRFAHTSETTVTSDLGVPALTQDALSAIYVLRTMTLRAGGRVTMPVTDDGVNYQVRFDAGAAEKVRTPIGEFSAVKVSLSVFDNRNQPVGRNVAIWISEDARRLPVKLTADLPFGNFELLLRDVK